MTKCIISFLLALYYGLTSLSAQPFLLKSIDPRYPFSFKIYYGTKGKGAFVQYTGQKGMIPLQLKTCLRDTMNREDGQPDEDVYVWNEIVNKKISGTYSLREGLRNISEAWYLRGKDNKKFDLALQEENDKYDGVAKYLLHGTLIEFNCFYNDTVVFRYPNQTVSVLMLPEIFQPGGARQSHIADYNFDGYNDVAFSVADAGMGVYQQFTIYLYNPKYRQFYLLEEPTYSAKAKCNCLCDVRADAKKKELTTSCRGGARWWTDVWRYKNGKLVWVRSEADPIEPK